MTKMVKSSTFYRLNAGIGNKDGSSVVSCGMERLLIMPLIGKHLSLSVALYVFVVNECG